MQEESTLRLIDLPDAASDEIRHSSQSKSFFGSSCLLISNRVDFQDIQKHVPENGRNDLRDSIETIQESLSKHCSTPLLDP